MIFIKNILCINGINLIFSDKESALIPSDFFNSFYVANLNENGEEISLVYNNNEYIANFFMIKISSNYEAKKFYKLLDKIKNFKINKIIINFSNGKKEVFNLSHIKKINKGKKIDTFNKFIVNKNSVCILKSDYKIKFYENLFE